MSNRSPWSESELAAMVQYIALRQQSGQHIKMQCSGRDVLKLLQRHLGYLKELVNTVLHICLKFIICCKRIFKC